MNRDNPASLNCSIGVFAHNEAENIAQLLESLVSQTLDSVVIAEIIVVSSASTDGTDELVEKYALAHPAVRLIRQEKREGKSSAINLFLKEAASDILVVISGDVVPEAKTIELLVSVFKDPMVGATGGRPIPINDPATFMGYAVHALWRLHHRLAMISPKLGEMIAFRKLMDAIPSDSAVDEASIEAIVRQHGLRLRYIPEAVIRNKGPQNIKDFVKQRRRIQNGHLWLKAKQSYKVSSQKGGMLFWIILDEVIEFPHSAPKLFAVMALEMYARILGCLDYHLLGKNPFAWEIVASAKKTGSGNQSL
ncbi:MAG: glycosyltransferase [Candidatus Cloacimonadaceae bacterium]|nr:glycosyltransferase [Candidatus Cloacimonadaceae bacterium]MDP3113288.1 glycosyltransferase [Candidatus Cloacimonadaceae bacterium]